MGGLGASSGGALGAGGLPVGMAGAFGTGGLGMAGAFGTGGMPLGSGGDTSAGGSVESGGATGAGGGALAKFAGNITTRGQVRSDFIDYWDQITPENEGKWGSVEGVRDQMNWAGLDAAYNYAKQHGIPFKQHTFVWGAQQPGWVAGLPQDQQREEVEEWIRLFCERYPDTQMIDVVNEPPPHTTPPYMAALGGTGASGYDWIVQAFRWARQYCPRSILILNDYNTIEYGNDNRHFIDIVNRIRGAGAPIDAIGAQAHAAFNVPTDTVRGYIDQLAATGLPVYISEYDIDLADDARQRSVMESQFTMFWNHPSVKGVTLWGYVQGSTWLPNSGLMSGTGQMRPAMTWLMGYLSR
jgi:endo-1,4-beta-xylanase